MRVKGGIAMKLRLIVFALAALVLALLPGIGAARIATNHNLVRL